MAIKMRAYFTIYGDNFNPDDITSELKLSPTYTWRKGDQIEKSLLLYKDDGWCIKTEKKVCNELSVALSDLLQILSPYEYLIRPLLKKYNLNAEIACAVYLWDDELPILYIEPNLLTKICALNCALDIDLIG